MKLKLLSLCALFSIAIFFGGCAGCSKTTDYPFHYEESEIKSISIIHTLESYDGYNALNEYETLLKIDDIDEFLTKFKEIQFGRYFIGDPMFVSGNTNVILVEYNNDDLEIINYYAQDIIINNELWFGKVYCDKEQFNSFINEYLTK